MKTQQSPSSRQRVAPAPPASAPDVGDTVAARLERAIERLEDDALEPGWVVHEVRKDLKRVRALLRLSGDQLPTRRPEKRAAAAARKLSRLRDADAITETVERLRLRAEPRELKALDGLREWFMHRAAWPGAGGLPAPLAAEAAGLLREARREIRALSFERMDAAALDAGLADSWSDTATAFRRLVEQPVLPRFHDFRKAAKRELHQRELCGRPLDDSEHAMLKKLADVLGELQDLSVLRDILRDADRWRGPVRKLVKRTLAELKARALRLGESRYPESRS